MKLPSNGKFINLLFIFAFLVLIATGIIAFKQIQDLNTSGHWVVHTHQVLETNDEIQLSLVDIESRLSLYALSDDISIISNVDPQIKNIYANIAELKSLTRDNPIQQAWIGQLIPLVKEKLTYINKIIKNVQHNKNITKSAAGSKERLALKERINTVIESIEQEESILLKKRDLTLKQNTFLSNLYLIGLSLLSIILFALAFIILNIYLHNRNVAQAKQSEAEKALLHSNEKLKKSEERYVLAVEGSNAGLWDWIPYTDDLFLSTNFKKILGYNDEALPNSLASFEKILHPHDATVLHKALEEHLVNHLPFNIQYRLRTKWDDYHWFQATGQAIWDEKSKPTRMIGSISDISERKQAEARLATQYSVTNILSEGRNLQQTLIQILEMICNGINWEIGAIWLIDEPSEQMTCQGFWQKNAAACASFKAATHQLSLRKGQGLPGRVWETANPVWVYDISTDNNFPLIEQAKNCALHSAFCFPITLQDNVLGAIEFFTLKKQIVNHALLDMIAAIGPQIGQFIQNMTAEKQLRESETYQAAVLKSSSDSIVTVDTDGIIISCNQQTTDLFRYEKSSLINQNIDALVPTLTGILASNISSFKVELVGVKSDGTDFPTEINIARTLLNETNVYVIFIRDITERKKVEKMKNEFVSIVSHELRTPLTSIRGSLGLMLSGMVGDFDKKAKDLLEIANNNCERLLLLINDILDIEKIEAGKMVFDLKPTSLQKMIDETIDNNKMYAEKFGVNLQVSETIADTLVNVDTNRFIQVLTNLISNAVKFSPKNGVVKVETHYLADNKVRIAVIDKGSGIPDAFQATIFQKFSQADSSDSRSKGGSGLGLNISKNMIEKMNGTLHFVSVEGKGSTFFIELPVYNEKPLIQQQNPETEANIYNKKLLICEDDEDQAKYLAALLQQAGFSIDVAYNVAQAKQLLAKNNYEALLLDLILPDQDGIAFIRELRQQDTTKHLPIIVLSVIAQTGKSLLNGEAFSVVDWLNKPIDFNHLLQSINMVKTKNPHALASILYVEDEQTLQDKMIELFNGKASITSALTIKNAKIALNKAKFDLVILDLMLPDGSGTDLISKLAEHKIPIIVYSAGNLDQQYAEYVYDSLLKSQITTDQLVAIINDALNHNHLKGES